MVEKNKYINVSDIDNNSIVTNNIVNRSISENRVNICNFLNDECKYTCDVVLII